MTDISRERVQRSISAGAPASDNHALENMRDICAAINTEAGTSSWTSITISTGTRR